MIIGLTGTHGAGKDTIAEYLKHKGFAYYSLSDVIRLEAKKRSIPEVRENLRSLGNELRQEFGPGVLAQRIKQELKSGKDCVIVSIRNPAEVAELRKLPDFRLLAVDAPIELRWQRVQARPGRARLEGVRTLEEFNEQEQLEFSRDPTSQQLGRVMAMADHTIINDSSIEQLHKEVNAIIGEVKNCSRLSIDEYFLKVAAVVAERSTCRRHHVGAVLVKDKHILSTGYNGAAAGVKDCLELGCLRDEQGIPSGMRHEVCRAIHAEQNAIIQAALHGKSTEGATLYCTHSPCILCAKMLVNAKITRFITFGNYADDAFLPLFKEAGIEYVLLPQPDTKIRLLK